MAIRTNALGSGALLVPVTNFKQAMTGATPGLTFAFMFMLPAGGMANNGPYRFGTHDANGNGTFADGGDAQLVIGGDNSGQGVNQRVIGWNSRGNTNVSQTSSGTASPQFLTGLGQLSRSVPYLFMVGVRNIGTESTPVWRSYAILGQMGGTPVAVLMPEGPGFATWLTEATAYFSQMGADLTTSAFRTPDGFAFEHTAVMWHSIPWDGGTDLPLISAVAPLYAGTATYDDPTFLNGGSIRDWRKLADITDLADYSPQNRAAATIRGTLVDAPSIGIGVWNGTDSVTIDTPPGARNFIGGRGTLSRTFGGTYLGSVTGIQYRVENEAGAALPGFDWQSVSTFGGGAWSQAMTLPLGGPYTLRIRATNNNSITSSLADLLVGTVVVTHGQSGVDRSFNASNLNPLNFATSAGVEAMYVDLTNKTAGVAPTYAQPGARIVRVRGGQTLNTIGQGVVGFVNEWHATGAGPVCIVNLAIGGTNMQDWADNATAGNEGTPGNWPFLGNLPVSVPGVSGPDGSGVMGYLSWLIGEQADLHLLMWTPGFVPAAQTAYRTVTDARFTVPGSAPWLILPPWRGDRTPPDVASTLAKRKEHVDWAASLPANIGIPGPCWLDVCSDVTGGLHSAFNSAPGVPSTTFPVSDGNHVGQARLGRGMGRAAAWVFNPTVKAIGPRMVRAVLQSPNTIRVFTGRALRTLNGAAMANLWWVSENGGSTWSQSGFTATFTAGRDFVDIVRSSGNWTLANLRVDYGRNWPFTNAGNSNDEANTERLLDGLLYDDQQYRGGINFTAGNRAGNPLIGTNDNGIAVAAPGAAQLVTTARFAGARAPVVRLMAADGVTVLAEKTLNITAAAS